MRRADYYSLARGRGRSRLRRLAKAGIVTVIDALQRRHAIARPRAGMTWASKFSPLRRILDGHIYLRTEKHLFHVFGDKDAPKN